MATRETGHDASRPSRADASRGFAQRVRVILLAALSTLGAVAIIGHYTTKWIDGKRTFEDQLKAQALGAAELLADFEADQLDAQAFATEQEVGPESAFAHRLFRRVARAVLTDTDVAFIALLDVDGQVLDYRPAGVNVTDATRPPYMQRGAEIRSFSAEGDKDLRVAIAPLPRGPLVRPVVQVAIGSYAQSPRVLRATSAWIFALVVALALAFVGATALGRLETSTFRPLRKLSQEVLAAAVQHAPRFAVENVDELERIALGVEQLRAELEHADHRATRLQRSIDSTVERETRQITLKLKRAEREAEVDALTGLANRRFIEERLNGLLGEFAERGARLAVIMLDVDHFKPLNDLAGHAAGDDILRFVGELLRGSLREGDVAIRYGGDEFAVVLLDVSGDHARDTAERLIRLFAQRVATMNLPTPVSLSAGVATLETAGACNGENLLARADAALYQSKRAGRNTVHVSRI